MLASVASSEEEEEEEGRNEEDKKKNTEQVDRIKVKEGEIRVEKPVKKQLTWQEDANNYQRKKTKDEQEDLLELLGPPDKIFIPKRHSLEEEVRGK